MPSYEQFGDNPVALGQFLTPHNRQHTAGSKDVAAAAAAAAVAAAPRSTASMNACINHDFGSWRERCRSADTAGARGETHCHTACAYSTLACIGVSLLPRRIIYSSNSAR